MKAAGAGDHIGPSKFFSLSAMIDLLDYKPVALCPQDEIGVFLKAITSRRASSHEAAVSQIFRSLWGVSFSTLPTPAWAARRMGLISCPAISVIGVLDPDEFYSALQGESINNGFLNRFLALQSNVRVTDATPVDPVVPDRLREALRSLYLWSGPASLMQINDPKVEYRPDVLPWASNTARTVFEDLVRRVKLSEPTNKSARHPTSPAAPTSPSGLPLFAPPVAGVTARGRRFADDRPPGWRGRPDRR